MVCNAYPWIGDIFTGIRRPTLQHIRRENVQLSGHMQVPVSQGLCRQNVLHPRPQQPKTQSVLQLDTVGNDQGGFRQ